MPAPSADPAREGDSTLADRAEALFCELIEAEPAERQAHLDTRCGDDRALREAVTALLAHHDNPPLILRSLTAPTSAPNHATRPRIGAYTILETIGRGGMGTVYRALQAKPHRTVALKVLSPTLVDPDSIARFDREIEVLGLLQHPGICRIHDAGSIDLGLGLGNVLYFAMEFIDGLPLGRFVQQHQLDRRSRCALVALVCDAVQHAHERGIVHRDLKPNNIMVVAGEQGPQPKVLDFGIARTLGSELAATAAVTRTGALLGTPQYMSPEHLEGGPSSTDARSDVYALGVILYELLAGRLPLELNTDSLAEVCRTVREREPVKLSRLDMTLRGDLEVITTKALAKLREERYPSAAELGEDLRRHLRGEPIVAQTQTTWRRLRSFARRNRALVGGVLAALACLTLGLIGVAILAYQNRDLAQREAQARDQAETTSERLRRALYGAQMRLNSAAFVFPGGVAQARMTLPRWLPTAGATDLRGFEWQLLDALCHEAVLVQPCEPRPFELNWLDDGNALFASHWYAGVLLDARTGEALARYPYSAEPLGHALLSLDRRTLIQSLTADCLVQVDPTSRTQLRRFEHDDEVAGATLSRDGAWLAVSLAGRRAGAIVVWDVQMGARVATIPARSSSAATFSRDGIWLAAVVARDAIQIWRTGAWAAPHRTLQVPSEYVMDLAFAPAADALASSSTEGWLRVHNLGGDRPAMAFRHAAGLRRVRFSPSGEHIAVGCEDYAAYVHDLRAGTVRTLAGHGGIVATVAFSPDGARLATQGDDHTLRIWDLRAAPTVRTATVAIPDAAHDCQLAWSRDGAELSVRLGGIGLHTWSLADNERSDGFRLSSGTLAANQQQVDRLVVSGPNGERTLALSCQALALSPSAPLLAVGERGCLRLLDLSSDRPAIEIAIHDVCRGLAFTRDGRSVACADGADTVRVFDAISGRETASRSFPEGALELDCAPHDDLIAVACVDQTIRLWSPTRGTVVELSGHAAHVQCVAFSPDGARLASGSKDGSVKIWSVADSSELLTLPHGHAVAAVAWRPDGRALASLDIGGQLKVWDAGEGLGR